MMRAAMMCMAGFPMLSGGDESGQLNGCGRRDDPDLAEDLFQPGNYRSA